MTYPELPAQSHRYSSCRASSADEPGHNCSNGISTSGVSGVWFNLVNVRGGFIQVQEPGHDFPATLVFLQTFQDRRLVRSDRSFSGQTGTGLRCRRASLQRCSRSAPISATISLAAGTKSVSVSVDGMLARVQVALRRASVIVECDTRRDHVHQRKSAVREGSFQYGYELFLVSGETSRQKCSAKTKAEHDRIDRATSGCLRRACFSIRRQPTRRTVLLLGRIRHCSR